MTSFLTGIVHSLPFLALMRFMCGLFQAALLPCLFSIIQDYFPPNKRTFANSLITASPLIGTGLASLNILLIAQSGWRGTYKLMAAFGFFIATMGALLVKEPERVK